tara:strand:+ start:25 stop:492 length:468 start_codon:yes stop_codon:yes gene_type:complete
MNLHKFQFFTYVYFIILTITIVISIIIKKYDFLLGIYLFTVPILVVGFVTKWFKSNNDSISNKSFIEKLVNDILLHWISFCTFMYILLVVQPKINNKLWFWLGYSFIIISSIFYFLLIGGAKEIENNYNHSFVQMIIIFISILLLTTIFTYYKLK